MTQTRAVLPSKFVPLADELLAITGVSDYPSSVTLEK
jgi:hypothetical protein